MDDRPAPPTGPRTTMRSNLHRLLAPRQIAVVGGAAAERVVQQCRDLGYAGELWAVHPTREHLAGIPCHRDVASLPGAPDAAFVSVPREATVEVVAALAERGAGGVTCHASGFAEEGAYGAALQRDLVAAAGEMALLGPNCLGLVNYLDGTALSPDEHGGTRVDRGVALLSQSGNIALNLSMQRRSLPVAHLVTVGNCAVTSIPELMHAMLDDPRVTAIGLYLEDLPDVAALSRVAARALRAGVPVVAVKAGSSSRGREVAASHTSALATPDVLCDALFRRLGIVRVRRLETFVETLTFLHVHGALDGARITSASCSGGEAAHVADLAESLGVPLATLPPDVTARLREELGERVAVGNPLDYHTWIWDDREALTRCFTALQSADADVHLLVLDLPRDDRCRGASYETALEAWLDARAVTGARVGVVSSLPENLPEHVGDRLLAAGVAPMHGLGDCLAAVLAARDLGSARSAPVPGPLRVVVGPVVRPVVGPCGPTRRAAGRGHRQADARRPRGAGPGRRGGARVLRRGRGGPGGLPRGREARVGDPGAQVGAGRGQARVDDPEAVRDAVRDLGGLGDRFLVERMVDDAVAELVVGVGRDPRIGPHLTLGAGGVLVELLRDTATLLLPAGQEEVLAALRGLRLWPLLAGSRGPAADVTAVVEAVERIAACACAVGDRLVDLEVNPLLALEDGAVAVDALVRLAVAEGERS